MPYAHPSTGVTFTSADLVAEVTLAAALPTSSQWDAANILALANRVIPSLMAEAIVSNVAMSGRWIDYQDVDVADAFRGRELVVPNLAASGTVSHVDYYATDGSDPVALEPWTLAQASEIAGPNDTGTPSHYYMRDGRVVLLPQPPSSGGWVRVYFPRRHPKLVESSEVVLASALVTPSQGLTVGDYGVAMSGFLASEPASLPFEVDIYSVYAPHDHLAQRLEITSKDVVVGAYSWDAPFSADVLSDLDVLDISGSSVPSYKLALAGTADCVMLPDSMWETLTTRVVSTLLRAQGDTAGANEYMGMARESMAAAKAQMAPRSKGRSVPFVNHSSPLRSRSRRRRAW